MSVDLRWWLVFFAVTVTMAALLAADVGAVTFTLACLAAGRVGGWLLNRKDSDGG